MNNNTCTYKGKTYIRVTKVHARHLFNAGECLILAPSKIRPFNCWGLWAETEQNECEYGDFDTLVYEFEYYNCDSETGKYTAFWICKEDNEEDIELPKHEVDWSKVPVDTLVRVREREYFGWTLRHFKGIDEKSDKKYVVWSRGGTSETTTKQAHWRYCELVENGN